MEKAQLYYSITFRHLWGTAGGKRISMTAYSGGRGGSTTAKAVDKRTMNNVFCMNLPDIGPLPIHEYTIASPRMNLFHRKNKVPIQVYSARLTPHSGGLSFGMFGRGSFYIHGRGPQGSEGCIVPSNGKDFQTLMDALKASKGGELTVWP